jgi:uncharacterized membrane protein
MITRLLLSDQKIEDIIGNLLRVGVLLAGGIVLVGGLVFLVRHGASPAAYQVFHGEPSDLASIPGIVKYAFWGHGRGIIQFGLLLLIATPIARVTFSLVAFALDRDWMYVGFTAVVLAVLCYSLFGT